MLRTAELLSVQLRGGFLLAALAAPGMLAACAETRPPPAVVAPPVTPVTAPTPLVVVTGTSVTLDGVAMEWAQPVDAVGLARIDDLLARLRQNKTAEVWLDFEPTATTSRALSALLTAAFAGARRVHIKTQTGWLDGEIEVPGPAAMRQGEAVHTRLHAELEGDKVAVSWQSDRPCDVVPPDATMALAALAGQLASGCGDSGPCLDESVVSVALEVPLTVVLATMETIGRHSHAFRFAVAAHSTTLAKTTSTMSDVPPALAAQVSALTTRLAALDGGAAGTTTTRRRCGRPLDDDRPLYDAGGLSAEAVRTVVTSHAGAIRACYDIEAQKNPTLHGGVTPGWQVDASGAVSNVRILNSTLGNPSVEGCVVRQIQNWRFPAADAKTTVAGFPFRFGVAAAPGSTPAPTQKAISGRDLD